MTRPLLLAALALAVLLPTARAQDATQGAAGCRTALTDVGALNYVPLGVSVEDLVDPCSVVATQVLRESSIRSALRARDLTPRDVQPTQGPTGSLVDTPAQSEAVAGVQPVALAGGTLAAAGTSDGDGSLAAISINPAMLFGPSSTEQAARLARTGDVTVLLPVGGFGEAEGGVEYVGLRARYNAIGSTRGAAVLDTLGARYRRYLDDLSGLHADLEVLLEGAPDVPACTRALLDPSADPARACGRSAPSLVELGDAALVEAAAAARREADAAYFGVDLRLDLGDATLGATPGADGVVGGVGLALGRRFGTSVGAPQLRARAGVSYARRDSLAEPRFGLAGAAGLVFSRPQGVQEISFGAAVEARYTPDADDTLPGALADLDDGYLRFRVTANVPIGPAYSASIALGTGTDGPVLSVSGNWQLLLPDAP